MWSEHCSYKSSRRASAEVSDHGPRVVQGPGENAGVIDIGDGWVAAFKMESHNHPSFIEPYQGAATGVGGILRDIFTMGARPDRLPRLAALRRARRAAHEVPRRRRRARHQRLRQLHRHPDRRRRDVMFHASYNGNILVNVFSLGVTTARARSSKARAQGVGNPVIYVGSKTGRDGIHGATDGLGRIRRSSRREASDGAGRRSVHGEAAARGVPGDHGRGRRRRHPGHGRGGADLVLVRDGRRAAAPASHATSTAFRCARAA